MKNILILIVMVFPLMVRAGILLDDSGTSLQNVPKLEWRNKIPSREFEDNAMKMSLALSVQLNMMNKVGKHGRIYLVFPSQTLGLATASWPAHGIFQAGMVSTGQRAVLWSGQVDRQIIRELMMINIAIDRPEFKGSPQIVLNFEWEDI